MTVLTGEQFEQLQHLLMGALDKPAIEELVRKRLGRRLDTILNSDQSTQKIVFELLTWIDQRGVNTLEGFLQGVLAERPGDAALRAFCEQIVPGALKPADSQPSIKDLTSGAPQSFKGSEPRPKIAISYRRADSAPMADRIRDRLITRYGADSVFMDIYNVPAGTEFPQRIRDVASQSDVLLALIGPTWLRTGEMISAATALQCYAVPLFLLLIAHYVVINQLDLNVLFLRAVCFLIPLPFGALLYWKTGCKPVLGFAGGVILGVIAAAAMSISASVRYGQPIWPTGTSEWLENLEYAVTIILGFWAGDILGRLPGLSRLFHKPEDWVEFEIETALVQNVPIIPVLLDGATMPPSEKLPRTIRDVAYRNATHVHSGPDFDLHMDRLFTAIDGMVAHVPTRRA
jgi:Effector-associated domain 1/TIR domain